MALLTDRAINGSYGKLFLGAQWLANIQRVEAAMAIEKQEVRPAGTRETGYKAMNTTGAGTISGLRVTTFWLKTMGSYQRVPRSQMPSFTLRYTLDDPDSFGVEEIELTRCKIWHVPFGYQNNTLLEESLEFTFQNHNLLSCIDGNLDEYRDGGTSKC
jgi:Phage tail tube protein